ncbi:hypothetical protein ACO0QE_001066 [Hanseniaspora vineae]
MNFLRNTFSSFPYYKDADPVFSTELWTVYNGTSKKDIKITCCIFEPNPVYLQQNKGFYTNALTNAKTLRFPGLVKVLEALEDYGHCIVTERVTPISTFDDTKHNNSIALGLFQLSDLFQSLANNKIEMASIKLENIYINNVGEWCLFQFPDSSASQGSRSAVQQFVQFIKQENYNTQLSIPNNTLLKLSNLQSHLLSNFTIVQIYQILKKEYPFLTHFNDSIDCLMELSKLLLPLNRGQKNADDLLEGIPIEFTTNFLFPPFFQYLTMGNGAGPQGQSVSSEANLLFLMTVLYNCKHLDIKLFENVILNQFDKHDRQITFLLLKFQKQYIPTTTEVPSNYTAFYKNLYPRLVGCLKDQDSQIRFETLKVFSQGFIDTMDLRSINNDFLRHLAEVQQNDKDPLVKNLVLKILCTQISEKLIGYHGKSKGLIILSAALCKHLNPKESVAVKKNVLHLLAEKIKQADWPMDVLVSKLLPGVAPCMMDKNTSIRKQANQVFSMICDEIKRQASLNESVDDAQSSEEDDAIDVDEAALNKYDMQIDSVTLVSEMFKTLGLSPNADFSSFHTDQSIPFNTNQPVKPPKIKSPDNSLYEKPNKLSTPDASLWEDTQDEGWDSWTDDTQASASKAKTTHVTGKTTSKTKSSWLDEFDDNDNENGNEDQWYHAPKKPVSKSGVVKKSSWLDEEEQGNSNTSRPNSSALNTKTAGRRTSSLKPNTTTKKPVSVTRKPVAKNKKTFEASDDDDDDDDWGNDDW